MSRVITGYHTVEDRDNADQVESNGPFICVRNDAWLGTGYYFWDTRQHWAHDWGNKCYVSKQKGYIVCEAQIRLDERIFDLFGDVMHQEEFAAVFDELDKQFPPGKDLFVRHVINYLKKIGAFPYDGIRAADEPKDVLSVEFGGRRNEKMFVGQRVQICLINKNNIVLPTFRIIFPEKYVM